MREQRMKSKDKLMTRWLEISKVEKESQSLAKRNLPKELQRSKNNMRKSTKKWKLSMNKQDKDLVNRLNSSKKEIMN
jgi:hypothetical protein